MERGAWKLISMAYCVISFILWFAIEGGNGCLVVPSAVAVIAGDNVSLTCTSSTTRINAWARGRDYSSGASLYQGPTVGINNSIVPGTVVDGYLVDDSVYGRAILIMNNASTVQADRYYCSCKPPEQSSANVTVLASKPTFSTTYQITDGGPVNMRCSVSINGTADVLLTIADTSGIKVADKSVVGTYPTTSTDLRVISMDYSVIANSSINQTYSCQVNLSDNNNTIHSEQVVTSVQWVFVRNVQIIPVQNTKCYNSGQCGINQILNCTAEGNPYPVRFKWTGSLNGSQFIDEKSGLLNLTSFGNYTIQCTASNTIGYITYSNTSQYFQTEVTVEGPPPPTPLPGTYSGENSKTSLIVGLVVGLGGGLILIIVSVIVVFVWKRKKRGTVCCNPDGNNQSVELNKTDTDSKTKDNGVKKNGNTTQGVLNKGSDEVTVVENDLYSREQNAKKIDPSDGGYAAINEVMSHGR